MKYRIAILNEDFEHLVAKYTKNETLYQFLSKLSEIVYIDFDAPDNLDKENLNYIYDGRCVQYCRSKEDYDTDHYQSWLFAEIIGKNNDWELVKFNSEQNSYNWFKKQVLKSESIQKGIRKLLYAWAQNQSKSEDTAELMFCMALGISSITICPIDNIDDAFKWFCEAYGLEENEDFEDKQIEGLEAYLTK